MSFSSGHSNDCVGGRISSSCHRENLDSGDSSDMEEYEDDCFVQSLLDAPNVTSDRNSCLSTICPVWDMDITVVATRCNQDKCHIYTIHRRHNQNSRARKKFLINFSSSISDLSDSNHNAIEAILLLQSSQSTKTLSNCKDNYHLKHADGNDNSIMLVVLTRDGTLWKSKLELLSWSLLLEGGDDRSNLNYNKIHYFRHKEIMVKSQLSSLDHDDPFLSTSQLWGMDTLISTNTTLSYHHQHEENDENLAMTTIIVAGKNTLSGPLLITIPLCSKQCSCAVQEILFDSKSEFSSNNHQITSILSFSNTHHHIIPNITNTVEYKERQKYEVTIIGMDNGSVWSCFWNVPNNDQYNNDNSTTKAKKNIYRRLDVVHAKQIYQVKPYQPIQSILILQSNLNDDHAHKNNNKHKPKSKLTIIGAQGNVFFLQNVQKKRNGNDMLWVFSQIYPTLAIGTITSACAILLPTSPVSGKSNIKPPMSQEKRQSTEKYSILFTNQRGNAHVMCINLLYEISVDENDDYHTIQSPRKFLPFSNLFLLSNFGSDLRFITSSYDHNQINNHQYYHNENTRSVIILSTYTKSLLVLEVNHNYFFSTEKRFDNGNENHQTLNANKNDNFTKNIYPNDFSLHHSIQEQDDIIVKQLSWLQSNCDSLKTSQSYSTDYNEPVINPNYSLNKTPEVSKNYNMNDTIDMRMKEIRNITSRSSFLSPIRLKIRNNSQYTTHSLKVEKIRNDNNFISSNNENYDNNSCLTQNNDNRWSHTIHFIHSATATITNHTSDTSNHPVSPNDANLASFPIYNETKSSFVNNYNQFSSDGKVESKNKSKENSFIPAFYYGTVISTSVPLENEGKEPSPIFPLWNRYPSSVFFSESIPFQTEEAPTTNISSIDYNETHSIDIATSNQNAYYYHDNKKRKSKHYNTQSPCSTYFYKKSRHYYIQHEKTNHHLGYILSAQNNQNNNNKDVTYDLLDGKYSQKLFNSGDLDSQKRNFVEENQDITASKVLYSQKMKNRISLNNAKNKKESDVVLLPVDKESSMIKSHAFYRSPSFESDEDENLGSLKLFRIRHLTLNSFESSIIPSILIPNYTSSTFISSEDKTLDSIHWLECGPWGGIDASCIFVDRSKKQVISDSGHNFKPESVLDLAIMCQKSFDENEISSILLLLRSSIMNRLVGLYQTQARNIIFEKNSDDESSSFLTEVMATQALEKYHLSLSNRDVKKVAKHLFSIIERQDHDNSFNMDFYLKMYSQIRSFQLPLG